MTESKKPYLKIQSVSKRFGATQALDQVNLTLYPGEIHALLGENGAGKSTLIKTMTGIHQPDSGNILVDGAPVSIHSSADAQQYGIAAIYQEPLVFPDLNIAENIFISHRGRGHFMRWGQLYRDAEAVLDQLGVKMDVRAQAEGLPLAAQQTVEIAKAISMNVRVLIMDEPTASLSAHEVEQLFRIIFNLREQGVAILFISHRMDEVFSISDRITVFRDGQFISSNPATDITPEQAIRDMVGRQMGEIFTKEPSEKGPPVLSVRDLSLANTYDGMTFDVHAGEVLGFAGLVGSGRTNVALALFGIAPADSGEIVLDGKPVNITSPEQAIDLGIAYVPEDRRQHGLILELEITQNISLPVLDDYASNIGVIEQRREAETAEQYRQKFSIRTPSTKLHAGKLSGGNQQKVVLSKWLNTKPRLLILDEPTRGIDVGAKEEVHRLISQLAQEGIAILMISSDLPEVLAMSDRILVMREGRQMGIFDREQANQESIMTAAMGRAPQSVEGTA
ncbi:MAG: sugar ABC transporter ATP-binding protein [Chloroflexota bacterium]